MTMIARASSRLRSWLSHTRFVPTPLYRLVLMAATVSSLLQLLYGAPESVRSTVNANWFDWAFVGMQLASAVLALVGLYLVEGGSADATALHRSLTLEWLGLIGLQTVIAIQLTATVSYQDRIPSTLATWAVIVFWLWSFFRSRDIFRARRALTRRYDEDNEAPGDRR